MMLSSVPQEWGPRIEHEGVALTRTRTGPNVIQFTPQAHMALVMFTPQPGRKVGLNSDHRTTGLAPVGSIEIVPARSDLYAGWSTDKQNLLFAVDPARMARLCAAEFDCESFEFRPPRLGTIDKKALELARFMRWELEHGEPGWRGSLDALATAFSIHLLRNYSSLSDAPERYYSGGLTPVSLRRVDDYIQSHLHERISIETIASVTGLSPSHFTRACKTSVGLSPHQYIMEARLARARELILTTDMTLATIAKRTGFSSNSHLATAMRSAWALTPSRLRRGR